MKAKQFEKEIFNSDRTTYWGTGQVFNPDIRTELVDNDQQVYKIIVNLPALAGIILK